MIRWPWVSRRRHEDAVDRHHAWHMDAHDQWARLFRAISAHKRWHDAHDYAATDGDEALWAAISPDEDRETL